MNNLKEYQKCEGCEIEITECYKWQNTKGYDSGLDFFGDHCSFFVIDSKTGEIAIS